MLSQLPCPYCGMTGCLSVDYVRSMNVSVYYCFVCARGGSGAGSIEDVIGVAGWMAAQARGAEPVDPARLPRYNYGAFRSDVPVVIGILHYEAVEVVVNPALLQGDEMLCSGLKVLVDIGYPPLLDGEVDEYDDQLDVWYVRLI